MPVGVALFDASGRIVLRDGALAKVWGPAIAARDPKAWGQWEVSDDDGIRIDPAQWPTVLALKGQLSVPGVTATCRAVPGETYRLRSGAIPFEDGRGFRGGLAFLHPIEPDDPRQNALKGYLQDRFAEALVDACVQWCGEQANARGDDTGRDSLTQRETQVLKRIAWGKSYKEIAAELGISVRTVEFHRTGAAEKLGLRSRADMLRYALNHNWLEQAPEAVPLARGRTEGS